MTHSTLSADVAAFLARGGAIQIIPMGVTSDTFDRMAMEARANERAAAAYGSRPVGLPVADYNQLSAIKGI